MLEHFDYFLKQEVLTCFDLNDKVFRHRIIRKYLKLYPNNYHGDDLEYLLEDLSQILEKEYGSTNALFLIFYVAKKILHHDMGKLYVKFDDLLEWDGFINKVDMKLFIVAKLLELKIPVTKEHLVSVLDHDNHYIYDLCARNGLSENHMHLKASGYVTDINWYCFLESPFFDEKKYKDFVNSDGIFEDYSKTQGYKGTKWQEKELVQYVMKIKFLRIVLASVAKNKQLTYPYHSIVKVLKSKDVELTTQTLNYSSKNSNNSQFSNEMLAKRIMKDLEKYIQEPYHACAKEDSTKYAQIEMQFLIEIFKKSSEKSYESSQFIRFLLNLYICGMTDLKFQFYQDNLGMGFDKFKEKEDNKKIFVNNDLSNQDIIRSAFHKYYREKSIKNIEFRVGPEDSPSEYLKLLETLYRINNEEYELVKQEKKGCSIDKIKYGVIVHFIKLKHQVEVVESNILKREKLESLSECLFETLKIIQKIPEPDEIYKNKIIGIDTANYELDNRPTIYSCTFRKMKINRSMPKVLYATYHVGEEFSTLVNGLRAIDEVLSFCGYRANDRFGHALALGIDPIKYYQTKKNNIMCSLGDYLDDIIWLYSIVSSSSVQEDSQILYYLRQEFNAYRHQLFSKVFESNDIPTFEDYYDYYFLKGDCPKAHEKVRNLPDWNYETLVQDYGYRLNSNHPYHKQAFLNEKARLIYLRLTYDKKLNEHFNQPFKKKLDPLYLSCISRAQELLREKVIRMNIYIEANPTSNKKISYIDRYIDLPALKLNQVHLSDNTQNNIPISINTDDSSIFQTNLTNEYSMIAAALIREGYSKERVYRYLEDLAIASNVHSFVGK